MGYSMNMGLRPSGIPAAPFANSTVGTAGQLPFGGSAGINPWGQGPSPFGTGTSSPSNNYMFGQQANVGYNPMNNPAMAAVNGVQGPNTVGMFGGANANVGYNPMTNPAMAAANYNIANSGGPNSSNINPVTGQPFAPGVGGNGYPTGALNGWTTPGQIAANNYVTGPGTMVMPGPYSGAAAPVGYASQAAAAQAMANGTYNLQAAQAAQAGGYTLNPMTGQSNAAVANPAATPATQNQGGLGAMFGGAGGTGQAPAAAAPTAGYAQAPGYGGTNPTNNPGINFPTVGVPAFQQANIQPIDQTAAWQAMVAAQQRNIQQGAANLGEQYNVEGGRFSTAFGSGMSDYYQQATLNQNAQLAQMQMQAMEQAQSLGVSAGLQTQQLGVQTGLQGQALGEQLTGTQMQTAAQIQAANIAAEAQKAVAQTQVGGQEAIANMETLAQEQEMQSQQAFQGQMAAYNAALQAAQQGAGLAGGAATQLDMNAIMGAQQLFGGANQAAMNMYSGQQNTLANYMTYLNQRGLGLGSLYNQNLGMGSQIGGQQYNIEQSRINNMIQQWMYSQPQNNPLLAMAYNAMMSYPPVYFPGYGQGALGGLMGGAGQLLGGLGMMGLGGGGAAAGGLGLGMSMAGAGTAGAGGDLAALLMAASAFSDKRLKENISYTGNEVDGLKEAEWDWKPELGGGHDKGFIAQDVQKTHPDMVVDIGGGILGVNYKGIASHLMKEFSHA